MRKYPITFIAISMPVILIHAVPERAFNNEQIGQPDD
jgi:hypothetical protein